MFKNVAHPTPPFPFPLKIGKIYSKKSKLTTYVILVFLEKEFDIPQMCFFIPKSLQEKCQNRKEFLGIMLKVAGLRMFAYIIYKNKAKLMTLVFTLYVCAILFVLLYLFYFTPVKVFVLGRFQ